MQIANQRGSRIDAIKHLRLESRGRMQAHPAVYTMHDNIKGMVGKLQIAAWAARKAMEQHAERRHLYSKTGELEALLDELARVNRVAQTMARRVATMIELEDGDE